MKESLLLISDQTKPFKIECNTLKYASRAILYQRDTNGDQQPMSFFSKLFSPAKQNYDIYNRELLADIRALEE